MLASAHQGYIYQDIIGAYFVAQELADGKGTTRFHFDFKKTPNGVPDKFDDLIIYHKGKTSFIQIKYSNDEHQHILTKQDFSSSSSYDLALFDLFETWKALHTSGCIWRVCLAWDKPTPDDPIQTVLIQLPDRKSSLPGTICYQFCCDALWPEDGEVLSSWRALRGRAKSIDRAEFKAFLDCLILEVNCPKSTLLEDYNQGLEKLLARTIERIGIGIYPNDHLTVRQVAESLCTIAERRRATDDSTPVSCDEIAKHINIIQEYGGVEQKFTVDENVLVATPDRVDQVVSVLKRHSAVILTAEPGAGKSWFIENLLNHMQETTQVVKHYCYTALEDPLALKRITVNVLYGSLITQILKNDEDLGHYMTKRYASNLEQLNILLGKIKKKTLLLVDGIDHIWRVYQKNRGGLTEDDTEILQAFAQLDYSNPNVSLLVVSQPIEQLAVLTPFYHCTLAQLPQSFVEQLLEKHAIQNTKVEDVSLAKVIHEKSNGNALYCKYLVDYAATNKTHTSFDWVAALPHYEFNLTGYYQYLYEQIQGDTRVPYALCGADFSLTEAELKEITHLGSLVSTQLAHLKPILRYIPATGYSIYHESFKRFVIDTINIQGASIDHLVYHPLIGWLETHSFFESTKAYGNLLKLYYEVDAYDAIAQTISEDFLDDSLYNAQPFHRINQNHQLHKASLQHVTRFAPMIIIAEQAKILYELENTADQVLVGYLKSVQKIHGNEQMYRVLWDEEHLLVETVDALRFLVNQAYQGKEVVHWSIVPSLPNIPYDILGFVSIKYIHTKQYEKFDALVKDVYEDPKHKKAFAIILDEVEWWCIHIGDDWIKETPYFQGILATLTPSVSTLEQAVGCIVSNDRFDLDDDWEVRVRDVVLLAKTASDEEGKTVINTLSHYNWFRNWLIYLVKITELSGREHGTEELLDAFTYLVLDLEPFKGKPRVCDLYKQLPFIKKSFHQGLLLCKRDEGLLTLCCERLEKVTNVTTSLQRSFSGPLTDEEYLEIIAHYLPGEYVIDKYNEYYDSLGARRVYSEVAGIAFEYAHVLSSVGRSDEAKEKYIEGVQALTAYGFRKDRTLSEVLDCSVPYQQAYGTLGVEWFYELYHMAMTVVTHTDGRSTNSYPIEWFKEFIKVYPDEALRFLVSETIESEEANWHQEDEFLHILEENISLFSPTQWFLLCRSIPIASSSKIIAHGLAVCDQIDDTLQYVYREWLQSLPYLIHIEGGPTYSKKIITQFEAQFNVRLALKKESVAAKDVLDTESVTPLPPFPSRSIEEAMAFLETNSLVEDQGTHLLQLLSLKISKEDKRGILRQVAKSFRAGSDVEEWVTELLEPESHEWLYFNVCLFVYLTDGWYQGLQYTHHLKRAYEVESTETIIILKEVLGCSLSGGRYTPSISCNLINALVELKVEESNVQDLLQATFQIVKRRLPHSPNYEINTLMYEGLKGFNRDEMVVALLIARLKTLTTEKTQGIIWSLTFIAQTAPETLFKPYFWAFSCRELLLPIHRAVLLQILKECVDQNLIPDELIGQLINAYPTGFFLEDQSIRSFVDYRVELDETSAKSVLHPSHHLDGGFFPYIHIKYETLVNHIGSLTGTYRAFAYKRDQISEKHQSYGLRTEKVNTPIVPTANAAYEVVNSQYYDTLKQLTYHYSPSYDCNLRFSIEEIVLQVGSLTRRPSCLPTPGNFPPFEVRNTSSTFEHENWVLLASKEKELYGERLDPKKTRESSMLITFGEKPAPEGKFYSQYLFNVHQYMPSSITDAPSSQPICRLIIPDTLERSSVVFVSPFIVKELGLAVDHTFHKGFQANDDTGEAIIKMISWREDYLGSVSDGNEVPCLEGVAVMVRADYYKRLLALYEEESWFVLREDFTK